jgi:hypothetical protein
VWVVDKPLDISPKGIAMNSSSTTEMQPGRTASLLRRLRCAAVMAVAVLGPVGFAIVETASVGHP